MKSKIWYTARKPFGPDYEVELSWNNYIEWSKLTHLSEVVSLDGLLNGLAFEPDFDSAEEWKYMIVAEQMIMKFFNSFEYVIEKTKDLEEVNVLAVVREPNKTKSELNREFDFVGYDLVETGGIISALTNCGGFDESFLPKDLNEFGLVTEWANAKKIQTDVRRNNPTEPHADCFLFEVWRHKRIGRKDKKSI